MTALFNPRIPFSKNMYNSAGKVEKAIRQSASITVVGDAPKIKARGHYPRPRNRASAVSVPYSDSNLSRSGVKASTFVSAWKKLRWMTGKVFAR